MTDCASPSSPVLIIGGGFSGAMLAARLAERDQASILIDQSGHFGLGLAYSARIDQHRLNVRSERMGAIADQADGFVQWLVNNYPDNADPNGFAPRRLYGLYVQDRLTRTEQAHPELIERVVGNAIAVETGAKDQVVTLSDGRQYHGRAVVLATGNPEPLTVSKMSGPRIIGNPWAPQALDAICPDDRLIILGTGLTMVDVILALEAKGWRGAASLVSRRGQLPRAHGPHHDAPASLPAEATSGPLSMRLRAARQLAHKLGWRNVMEGYRSITIRLWREATTDERARFLRHLRPWWDVHRHRIAPEIADCLDSLIQKGRLTRYSGHTTRLTSDDRTVKLQISQAKAAHLTLSADWLIDCTGPGHAPLKHPLTANLVQTGAARLDALKLGLDLDEAGHVLDHEGRGNPNLLVLGPPARAALWETIAVPDIRNRIEAMSAILVPCTKD